jgi:HicB family
VAVRGEAKTPQGEPSHSGRLLLRMPKTLHAELAARSDAAGKSLNQYIVAALTHAVSGADAAGGTPERRPLPRSVRLALVANAVVVAFAAVTAVVVLLVGVR